MKKNVKFSRAFDMHLKKWVEPKDFTNANKAEWYDKPRYYATDREFDIDNDILTYVQESKPFRRKNMKPETPDVVVQAHFASICKNTAKNREYLKSAAEKQESEVHMLAKQIAKNIGFIKIPAINADMYGDKIELMQEQFVPVIFKEEEAYDDLSGTIPDVKFATTILGVYEEIHLEILYSHRVDYMKRSRLENAGISCLEVDLSDLKSRDRIKKDELSKIIKERIQNCAYWVTNRAAKMCTKILRDKYILGLQVGGKLYQSNKHPNSDRARRAYVYKDTLGVSEDHPCYMSTDDSFNTNYGKIVEPCDCKACEYCMLLEGYEEEDILKLRILCDKTGELHGMPGIKVMNFIKENIIAEYKESCKLDT